MQAVNFDEVLENILLQDNRHHCDAYLFVREALDCTQKMVNKDKAESGGAVSERLLEEKPPRVTGQQLLAGTRACALEQFGPMTLTMLHERGMHSCEDFGEIVFNMVESNLLAKTKRDTREHFKDGYDFVESFQRPFQPATRLRAGAEASASLKRRPTGQHVGERSNERRQEKARRVNAGLRLERQPFTTSRAVPPTGIPAPAPRGRSAPSR